jgi:hypothetical protein
MREIGHSPGVRLLRTSGMGYKSVHKSVRVHPGQWKFNGNLSHSNDHRHIKFTPHHNNSYIIPRVHLISTS